MTQKLISQYTTSSYKDTMNFEDTFGKDEISKQDFGARLKGVVISKPIVYGSVAHCLPEKRPDGRTHRWTVFVKPYHNEDLSVFIKKVHFKLHDSYGNCNRTVTKMPYEVSETGWGEFEIVIKIYFQDPNEKPVTVYHVLKLFHSGADANDAVASNLPVYCENYEEIVFQDPTVVMRDLLVKNPIPYVSGEWKHHTDFEKLKVDTVKKLQEAKKIVQEEIEEQKIKLKVAQETLTKFKEAVMKSRKVTPATSYLAA